MSTEIEIELPDFIELKESNVCSYDLGAFSRITIKPNEFVGNFVGKIRNSIQQNEDLTFIWTILSTKQVPIFYIDATDPKDGNWLRFIRSTNDFNKQNIICLQQDKKINYYTLKEIKAGDELVCYSSHETCKKAKPISYEIVSFGSSESDSLIENEESKDSFNTQNLSDDDTEKASKTNGKRANKSKNGKKVNSGSSATSASGSNTILPQQSARIWTCQMCKKQFEQRVLLNRHDCIDLKLRLFKKKKELRKKKQKDLHWKRKIDLSYIETMNLTHLFNNIADNLSFCIDGTKQDLKSYSKEVKDYLNSMVMNKENTIVLFRK